MRCFTGSQCNSPYRQYAKNTCIWISSPISDALWESLVAKSLSDFAAVARRAGFNNSGARHLGLGQLGLGLETTRPR